MDYLAAELRSSGYRQVYAALMAPGVTVEQASDTVLLRFDCPASVLNRPGADPAVQEVIRRRRAHAAGVLQLYRGVPWLMKGDMR